MFRVQGLGFRFRVCGCLVEKQHFDQIKFRKHLYDCFVKGELTLLPTVKERMLEKNRQINKHCIPMFCKCRMPDYICARSIECAPIYRKPGFVGILRLRCAFYRSRQSIESAEHIYGKPEYTSLLARNDA